MSDRTFQVGHDVMRGDDVKGWQQDVKRLFRGMDIKCPIKVDGIYGVATRSYTASLCRAMGLKSAEVAMQDGVTPELRIKLRNKNLTAAEKATRDSKVRKEYRIALRKKWGDIDPPRVHTPTPKIITDDWGYHLGKHDGVDIITPANAVIFAMVDAQVIDVRDSGWWGLGAPRDPQLKAKGDGIIQIEVLKNVGPFKKGQHLGYGHAEKAYVHVGQKVRAGQPLGHAGLANAWHIHFMANDGSEGTRGVGTFDPRPLIDYAVKHSR